MRAQSLFGGVPHPPSRSSRNRPARALAGSAAPEEHPVRAKPQTFTGQGGEDLLTEFDILHDLRLPILVLSGGHLDFATQKMTSARKKRRSAEPESRMIDFFSPLVYCYHGVPRAGRIITAEEKPRDGRMSGHLPEERTNGAQSTELPTAILPARTARAGVVKPVLILCSWGDDELE